MSCDPGLQWNFELDFNKKYSATTWVTLYSCSRMRNRSGRGKRGVNELRKRNVGSARLMMAAALMRCTDTCFLFRVRIARAISVVRWVQTANCSSQMNSLYEYKEIN